MKINISQLGNVISDELDRYREDVKQAVAESVKVVAADAADDLRQTAPKDTGDYRASWTYKQDRRTGDAVVYAKAPEYRLTHLLEFGHVNRDGTRTAPEPHIKDARDRAEDELIEEVTKRL